MSKRIAAIAFLIALASRTSDAQGPTLTLARAGASVPKPAVPTTAFSALRASPRSVGPKATSGTVWSIAGAAGGLLIGFLVGESIRQGTVSGDSATDAYNAKMAPTMGLGLIVPLGAALGAAYGVNNIGDSHGNKKAVVGVAVASAYLSAAIVIASHVKRDDPELTRFKPRDIYVPLPVATVLSSLTAALITDAAARK